MVVKRRELSLIRAAARGWRAGVPLILGVAAVLGLGAQNSREIRLTITEGTSMAAAVSPDRRTIAIDLLGALWTLSIDGGSATRILEDGYDARMPAWSPDGQRLAFQAYRSSTWNLWTIKADGTDLRQVTSSPFDDREPHWSPDGTRLAFSSDRGGSYDVWTLALASGELRQVTTGDANEFAPAWSPDGRELLYVSDRRDGRGVYVVGVESGAERLVRAEPAAASAPVFAPDGKTVVHGAIDGPRSRLMVGSVNIADDDEDVFPFRPQWLSATELLYTADGAIKRRPISGGQARRIAFAADVRLTRAAFTPKARPLPPPGPQPVRGIMHPVISPDGTQAAFAALGDLWILPIPAGDAPPQRVTGDAFVETEPAWSPDGGHLAYSTDRGGTMDIWIRELKSGRERKLASRGMSAAWSPDGARLAYLDPESQLQIVDVASGEVHHAYERLNEPGRPSWSPDGRAVVMSALRPYSTRFREGTNQVLRVEVATRGAPPPRRGEQARWFNPVPHKSIGMREDFGPVWSPDGTQMAAIVDGFLVTIPVNRDGEPMGPPRRLSSELAGSPSWTADSRRLLYQTAAGLRIVDVIDGRTREVGPRMTWTA
ncbi:MAG: amidohydrolase, partial [Acidobacteriota bacterium]